MRKFEEIVFNKEFYFSLVKELESNTYYLTFPVSSGAIDYDEYYKVDRMLVEAYPENIKDIISLLTKCRQRKMDHMLLDAPGERRGFPILPPSSD